MEGAEGVAGLCPHKQAEPPEPPPVSVALTVASHSPVSGRGENDSGRHETLGGGAGRLSWTRLISLSTGPQFSCWIYPLILAIRAV